MKSSKNPARLLLVVLALASAPVPVISQMSSPGMVVKQTQPKPVWLKAEVIHADANSIIVRDLVTGRSVQTFTYNDKVRAKMQALEATGGFQSGDKVKIQHLPGQTVALKIKGKPSKTL